jgi:hypothetical protein
MSRSPFFLNAGEARIFGTQVSRKVLMPANPAGPPAAQVASWPSSQRLGVMKE